MKFFTAPFAGRYHSAMPLAKFRALLGFTPYPTHCYEFAGFIAVCFTPVWLRSHENISMLSTFFPRERISMSRFRQ
jgi:hypothetical protein